MTTLVTRASFPGINLSIVNKRGFAPVARKHPEHYVPHYKRMSIHIRDHPFIRNGCVTCDFIIVRDSWRLDLVWDEKLFFITEPEEVISHISLISTIINDQELCVVRISFRSISCGMVRTYNIGLPYLSDPDVLLLE